MIQYTCGFKQLLGMLWFKIGLWVGPFSRHDNFYFLQSCTHVPLLSPSGNKGKWKAQKCFTQFQTKTNLKPQQYIYITHYINYSIVNIQKTWNEHNVNSTLQDQQMKPPGDNVSTLQSAFSCLVCWVIYFTRLQWFHPWVVSLTAILLIKVDQTDK